MLPYAFNAFGEVTLQESGLTIYSKIPPHPPLHKSTKYLISYKSSHYATKIQRLYRGYIGRQYFKKCMVDRNKQRRMDYYNNNATQIQRIWRGFYTRKNILDFKYRKLYLQQVNVQMQKLKVQAETHQIEQRHMLKRLKMEKGYQELMKRAGQSHHLIGTKKSPGIYHKQQTLAVRTIESKTVVTPISSAKSARKESFEAKRQWDESIFIQNPDYKRWIRKNVRATFNEPTYPVKISKSAMMLFGKLYSSSCQSSRSKQTHFF